MKGDQEREKDFVFLSPENKFDIDGFKQSLLPSSSANFERLFHFEEVIIHEKEITYNFNHCITI